MLFEICCLTPKSQWIAVPSLARTLELGGEQEATATAVSRIDSTPKRCSKHIIKTDVTQNVDLFWVCCVISSWLVLRGYIDLRSDPSNQIISRSFMNAFASSPLSSWLGSLLHESFGNERITHQTSSNITQKPSMKGGNDPQRNTKFHHLEIRLLAMNKMITNMSLQKMPGQIRRFRTGNQLIERCVSNQNKRVPCFKPKHVFEATTSTYVHNKHPTIRFAATEKAFQSGRFI